MNIMNRDASPSFKDRQITNFMNQCYPRTPLYSRRVGLRWELLDGSCTLPVSRSGLQAEYIHTKQILGTIATKLTRLFMSF